MSRFAVKHFQQQEEALRRGVETPAAGGAEDTSASSSDGDGEEDRPSVRQVLELQRCLSSVRDEFQLGRLDQLILTIVVFGASGDLAKKKTYPALFQLYSKGFLPAGPALQVLGYARSQMSDDQLRQRIAEYLPKQGEPGHEHVVGFLERCSYVSGEYDTPAGYEALAARMSAWERRLMAHLPPCMSALAPPGVAPEDTTITIGRLFYMALPPSVYPQVTPLLSRHCGTVPEYGGAQNQGKSSGATASGSLRSLDGGSRGAGSSRASFDASPRAAAQAPAGPLSEGPPSPGPDSRTPSISGSGSGGLGATGGAGSGGSGGSGSPGTSKRQWWVRMILEKPFGSDLDSSERLAEVIGRDWPEEKLYRIDHYLGKELVQNLLVLRFANELFSSFWNRHHIDNVIINFKEPFGTQGRGGYFDQYGIIRDVIQNHLIQVLALLAMETPVSLHPDDIRDEKVKVLRCVVAPGPEDCVLGQYTAAEGNPGYHDDPTVPQGSRTPTFAAVKLHIRNDRWEGVPFIIKAGKALNERLASVRIQLKTPAASIFGDLSNMRNELVIRFQPAEAMYAKMVVKKPGLEMAEEMSELDLTYPDRYKDVTIPDAYERLILDCIRGDQQHFVRRDELRAAWAIFTPLLRAVDAGEVRSEPYPYGSRGPACLDQFMSRSGFIKTQYAWRAKPTTSDPQHHNPSVNHARVPAGKL